MDTAGEGDGGMNWDWDWRIYMSTCKTDGGKHCIDRELGSGLHDDLEVGWGWDRGCRGRGYMCPCG